MIMDENEIRQSNPPLPVEMVEDAQKIKGDAIGSTLYSQCWVLKVLMKLAQLSNEESFNEELEKDLCLLWDMTVEEDVVMFLVENDILNLIVCVLQKEQEPRLMEILVGMLANMCAVAEVCRRVTSSIPECELMVRMLFCVDSLTLVQLMRLYVTCLQRLRRNVHENGNSSIASVRTPVSSRNIDFNSEQESSENQSVSQSCEGEHSKKPCSDKQSDCDAFLNMFLDTDCWLKQITFLLQSSTNGALLSSMLQMLDDLYLTLADCSTVLPSVCTAEMIAAIMEALKELGAGVSSVNGDASRKAIFHAVSILSNFVDSEQGTTALCEMSNALASYFCQHVDTECLCNSLSLDCVQFIMRCLNIFGCMFASLDSKTDVTCWTVFLLGHLTERVAERQESLSGEDGFEAKDKEEEERYFDSDELILAVENFCIFIRKCLSADSTNDKMCEVEEIVQGQCKHEHVNIFKSVVHKYELEISTQSS